MVRGASDDEDDSPQALPPSVVARGSLAPQQQQHDSPLVAPNGTSQPGEAPPPPLPDTAFLRTVTVSPTVSAAIDGQEPEPEY